MGDVFFRMLVVLFVFAILNLIVGVANDAVNFLNSAVGSKVAPLKTILIIASLGILVGSLFSTGMMEVTRKGLFNPEMFSFESVMIIFVAVFIADILLLDLYNTLRLPTSTTVSEIFEILGAACTVAFLILFEQGEGFGSLISFINASSTLTIMSGIFLSIGIAFISGIIVQYIVRMIVTYDYEARLKKYGGLLGGIAITTIVYFLLIKGIKDSNIVNVEQYEWIKSHTMLIIGIFIVVWSVILHLGQLIRKRNIPKIIVLVGTFALAMAFAGNDLVNFIGVTMAGYNSYQIFTAAGSADPSTFMMGALAGKVPTNFLFLFFAGAIMVATMRYSRKARSVIQTEVGLTKESVGLERFSPSMLSRALVRYSIVLSNGISAILPKSVKNIVNNRFQKLATQTNDQPAFDLIRASVNLVVASILIALATTQKLPLSTTYVTFMVAMGTALADGARGRDSAVFRVNGVLTIIGGRFLTAAIAFVGAGLVSAMIWYGGHRAIAGLVIFVFFYLYKTHIYHQNQESHDKQIASLYTIEAGETLLSKLDHEILTVLPKIDDLVVSTLKSIRDNQIRGLKNNHKETVLLSEHTHTVKSTVYQTFSTLPIESLQVGDRYVQAIDYLRKSAIAMQLLTNACLEYLLNEHPHLIESQQEELKSLSKNFKQLRNHGIQLMKNHQFEKIEEFDQEQTAQLEEISRLKITQLGRIKNNELGVRNTMLYFTILGEMYNLYIYIAKLIHLHRKVARGLQNHNEVTGE